jgi:hypothetical protein
MSLLQNLNGWLSATGEPVQGITPPSVRLRSGVLTPERRDGAQDAFSRFLQAKKLSLAGGGYFTGDELLPDGTRVRMISINGVDHVHIWASDPAPEEAVDVTFWCQPFDEDWFVAQYEEVFTIPRWFDINDSDADTTNDSPDFLRDLLRNEVYEPPESTNYPGNLTWFVPGAGLVVSWWGQMRRYSNSLLDQTIDEAKSWLRPTDPRTTYLTAPPYGPRVGPTGGVAGALAGQLFHQDGVTTLPGGLPATPLVVPRPSKSSNLWFNGKKSTLPGGALVESACSGFRSGKAVLRATSFSAPNQLLVWEQETVNYTWVNIATLTLSATALGIHHPEVITVTTPTNIGPGWVNSAGIEHPFYWNADGNKAVGLVRFTRDSTIVTQAGIVHAVVELTVGPSSCSLALIDHSRSESTSVLDSTDTGTTGSGFGTYSGSHVATVDTTETYVGVLAADYSGNDLVILRTHITEELARSENWSQDRVVTTTIYSFTDALGPASIALNDTEYDASSSISQTSTVTTWASRNGVQYPSTLEVRTSTLTASTTEHELEDQFAELNPAYVGGASTEREYRVGTSGNERDGGSSATFTASGAASLWGLTAGDLRGEFVLHSQPLHGASDTFEADRNSSYSRTETYLYPAGGGGGSSATATFSKTLRTDIGRLMRGAGTSTSLSELTKLINPNRLEKLGSGTQNWVDGVLTTSTGTGPYGAGPVWTDFAFPSTGYSLGTSHITTERDTNYTRNFMRWPYPAGAPSDISPSSTGPITEYVGGGASGPGAFANTVLVGCAMTPDVRVQYTGALMTALCHPTAPTTPITHLIDRWTVDGTEFVPDYPDQPDPGTPGAMLPFPHRGGGALLLNPIFTGPLP